MSGATPARLGPLREREFRLLFVGRTVSTLGSAMAPVGLAFAILNTLHDSPSAIGIVLAARQIPMVVLLLVGGVWGDRLRRNQVMVASNAASFLSQGLVAALLTRLVMKKTRSTNTPNETSNSTSVNPREASRRNRRCSSRRACHDEASRRRVTCEGPRVAAGTAASTGLRFARVNMIIQFRSNAANISLDPRAFAAVAAAGQVTLTSAYLNPVGLAGNVMFS